MKGCTWTEVSEWRCLPISDYVIERKHYLLSISLHCTFLHKRIGNRYYHWAKSSVRCSNSEYRRREWQSWARHLAVIDTHSGPNRTALNYCMRCYVYHERILEIQVANQMQIWCKWKQELCVLATRKIAVTCHGMLIDRHVSSSRSEDWLFACNQPVTQATNNFS